MFVPHWLWNSTGLADRCTKLVFLLSIICCDCGCISTPFHASPFSSTPTIKGFLSVVSLNQLNGCIKNLSSSVSGTPIKVGTLDGAGIRSAELNVPLLI